MLASITNNSTAPQGVHTDLGLKFIPAGETRDINIAEDYVERTLALAFFDVTPLAEGAAPAQPYQGAEVLAPADGEAAVGQTDPLNADAKDGMGGSIDALDQMKAADLKKLAAAESVDLMGATKRADIIAAIRLDREAKAG